MNLVFVTFENSKREYIYKTRLNLEVGAQYKIKNENNWDYDGAIVTCRRIYKNIEEAGIRELVDGTIILKKIVSADRVRTFNDNKDFYIQNIYENYKNGITTVIWNDGEKTMLKCSEEDEWDTEKVIALAYMKRYFGNGRKFKDEIDKWQKVLDERWEKEFEKCV